MLTCQIFSLILHKKYSARQRTRNRKSWQFQHFANHLLCHRNLNCKNISIGHLCTNYDESNPPKKSYIILYLSKTPPFCSFVIKQFWSPNHPMKDEKYTIIYGLQPEKWLVNSSLYFAHKVRMQEESFDLLSQMQ